MTLRGAFYASIPKHLLAPVLEVYMIADLTAVTVSFCERFDVPLLRPSEGDTK